MLFNNNMVVNIRQIITLGSLLEGMQFIGPMAIAQAILSGSGFFVW
ncbi:MAG: hypothetical protein FWG67_04560 [Defluviitaleaceae bacterium]|nr:hypothetical protein [Defluviitaleaceae bacterium]